MDRHEKWTRVEPGHVIPAGQPYRWENVNEAVEGSYAQATYTVPRYHVWFVDSTWRPPLELPTEPTWGIAVKDDGSQWLSMWRQRGDALVTTKGPSFTWGAGRVLDFIPLTEDQVARIEAAR